MSSKREDQVSYSCVKITHLYPTNSLMMHNNWSHCLQEFFSSGTLAENHTISISRILLTNMKLPVLTVEGNIGAGKTNLLQKFEESSSSVDNLKIRVEHEPISEFQSFHGNKVINPL